MSGASRSSNGRRFNYANVMATLAVFIALGGAAYAATQLPKNSVKAKQIAKNAVRSPEVKAGAIKSPEVRDESLEAGDFKPTQLPTGPQGPQGDEGAPGQQGQQGEQGAEGPAPLAFAIGSFPPSDPDTFVDGVDVSAPGNGRVFVTASVASITVDCNPNVDGFIGLYVDGAPVVGTRRPFIENLPGPYAASGVSDSAPLGQVGLGVECTGAANNPVEPVTISPDRSLAAIDLGE